MPLLTLETPYTSKDERRFFSVNSLERNYCRFSDNVADTNAGQMRRSSTASRRRRTSMTSGCFSAARCELDRRSRPSTGWSTTTTRSSWQHGRHGRRVGRRLLEYRHGASYQLRLPVPSTVFRTLPAFLFSCTALEQINQINEIFRQHSWGNSFNESKTSASETIREIPAVRTPNFIRKKNRRQTNRQTDKQTDEQKDSTVALCPRFCEQEHNNLSIGYILFANSNVEWSSVTVLLEQWYLTF